MTQFSKTSTLCDCGWIAQALEDSSSSGVHFCADQNMIYLGCNGSQWKMYHCPFCGGMFPDSSQPIWVPILSPDERAQLQEMCSGHTSAESIIDRLGPPDYDALMHCHLERDGELVRDDSVEPTRNLEYYGLSEFANLEFYTSKEGKVTSKIVMKMLSPRYRDASGSTKTVEPTGTGRLLYDPLPNQIILLLG